MPQEEKVPKKVNVLFCVLHGRIQERTCLVIGTKHRGIKGADLLLLTLFHANSMIVGSILGIDANFRLKRLNVSKATDDPDLNKGLC